MAPDDHRRRDFLLHLESYLSRRDGVDKLLKISRYAAKIALAASPTPHPRLKSFESSVGLSRKAFRLGKFVQDVNSLRAVAVAARGSSSQRDLPFLVLSFIAHGGEGVYYFVEQFVWLCKAGLLPKEALPRLQLVSAWAELVGYVGSVAIKVREVQRLKEKMAKEEGEGELEKLRDKLLLKRLSIVQDLADALMALADVRDGKGPLTDPLLLSAAGLLSALISTHKNWAAC